MPILTRYLLRAQVGPLLFAFVALTGLVLINTLARSLAELAGKGLPARVFLEFFALSLPANVALTLPMSVLVAVLYTFSQMAAENEITALRASGVDLRRLVLPLLGAAAIVAGGMVWFNNQVLPAANHRWRLLMADVAQTSPLLLVRPQVVNSIESGDGSARYYLRAGEVNQATNLMRGVTIYDVSDPAVSRTIYADSARMRLSADGTDLVLVLLDGHIREVRRADAASFQRAGFSEHLLRLPAVRQALDRTTGSGFRSDREMAGPMMLARLDTLRAELRRVETSLREEAAAAAATAAMTPSARGSEVGHDAAVPVARGSAADREAATPAVSGRSVERAAALRALEGRVEPLRFRIRELQVEVQKKYAIAAATFVFVLIGVPLALRFPHGGVGMVIAASLTIFSIYYVGLIGGEALGNAGIVPPILAMWITNMLFGSLGLVGMWRLGRETSTGRDGGWGGTPRLSRLLPRRGVAARPVEAR